MKMYARAALAAAIGLGGAAALAQPAGGPVAVYWVSAATSTGMMGAMMGAGGAPDRAAMMRMAMGGGDPNAANHTLTLQLGSLRHPDGAPEAEHDPPPGLGVGPALPLIGPAASVAPPPEPDQPGPPPQYRRPNGRMLIYWGCGEHAGPGQPVVFDFAKISADPQAFAGMMRGLGVEPMRPPSPGRFPGFGEWPNRESSVAVPAEGSLVGEHVIKSNYAPQIRFSLGPDQDFMAPLQLVSNSRTPSGAVRLAWNPVPTALGYFASVMGAGGPDNTVVIWTSSATQAAAFITPDYLPPAQTRRLVADGHLMGPERTECMVPQEVASQAHGLVQLAAYGDEANFDYPPRPASPEWAVKVRYRSTTSGLLGQPNPFGGGRPGGYGQGGQGGYGQEQDQPPPPEQQQQQGGFTRGLGGFIP